jgi:hypothetical protein
LLELGPAILVKRFLEEQRIRVVVDDGVVSGLRCLVFAFGKQVFAAPELDFIDISRIRVFACDTVQRGK